MGQKMIRVGIVVLLSWAVIGCAGVMGMAQEMEPDQLFGLSLPTFGSVKYNDDGEIYRTQGLNLGLGFSRRNYTSEGGLQPDRFNTYWGWGTVLLVIPYIEFGLSYPLSIADGEQFIVFDVGLFYIAPYISISIWY